MNKFEAIIIIASLIFLSCRGSSEPTPAPHKPLTESIRERQEEIANEAPSKPEYETVQYWEVNNTYCYGREYTECGVTFWECDDGFVYGCMTSVKYKVKSKEVRAE